MAGLERARHLQACWPTYRLADRRRLGRWRLAFRMRGHGWVSGCLGVWWRDGFPAPALARQPSRALRDATKLVRGMARTPPADTPGNQKGSPAACDPMTGEPKGSSTFGTVFAVQSTFRHLRYSSEHFHRLRRQPSPHNARPRHVSFLRVGHPLWTPSPSTSAVTSHPSPVFSRAPSVYTLRRP
jgi:hypothetical protein